MARTPESKFVHRIEHHLSPKIHCEGMANPYRGGTPDRYYESIRSALWVEYKYSRTIPKNWDASKKITALQRKWLSRAFWNRHEVLVIAGFGNEAMILTTPTDWEKIWTREEIDKSTYTLEHIVSYIERKLLWKDPLL
jgi:hypothetical protein